MHGLITFSSGVTSLVLAVFTLPAVNRSPAGLVISIFILTACVVNTQSPNQTRIKTIADRYAPKHLGRIAGRAHHKPLAASYDAVSIIC